MGAVRSTHSSYARIYAVVRRIPKARSPRMSVARLAGFGHARQVGYALHALPAEPPCPGIAVNAKVKSPARPVRRRDTQRLLLEKERALRRRRPALVQAWAAYRDAKA